VQSGTLAEMIVEGAIEKPDMIVFADTGDEPQYVYKHMAYLSERLAGVDLQVVTASAGDLVKQLMSPRGRFAAISAFTVNDGRRGRLKRQCTSDYKIAPIEKAVKEELVQRGMARRDGRGITINKGIEVEAWIGISTDEAARMKPSRTRWITNRWPLIEKRMSRADCRRWLDERGLPIPGRSSCRICPYHNDSYWRDMRDNAPDDWAYVVDFDNSLRDERPGRFKDTATGELFLHSSCVPLADVDIRSEEERGQLRLFDDDETLCDGGYCFI
jgi:hypothetical protein